MKLSSREILSILRSFEVASIDDSARQIDRVEFSHPSRSNSLVSFRYKHKPYFIFFDESAEDDVSYIESEIQKNRSEVVGQLIENPTTHIDTYGLPYKGKDCYLFRAHENKKRLDQTLANDHPTQSRSTWQKHIKAGRVSVNGEIVISPKFEVGASDNIAISLPPAIDHSDETLPIIYIDDHVIVINKPVGVLTHSKGALNDEFTVADFVRRYTTVGLDTDRPGIVHRLDRDTSGVIIAARTPEAFEVLKRQFADRVAHKSYLAITSGSLKNPKAAIDIPIGRNPNAPSTFRADAKGKPALTNYQVLAVDSEATPELSLVSLRPKTGRTHQLRVHMAYLESPILGDPVYGRAAPKNLTQRMYLHAHKLEITTPPSTRRTFTAPAPEDFKITPDFTKAIETLDHNED